jgi:GTP-binding protein EngB required for normal cell division
MKKEEQLAPSLDPDSQVGAGSREPEMLNENHRFQLRYTFQCIDSVLTEIEQILADPECKSAFSPYTSDVTLTQRRIARDYISRIRARMTNLMREQVIPFARPRCGTRWAALTTLLGAAISTEELTPDRMRGYGEVSGEARKVLQSIRAELGLVIGNLRAYLEECATADLEERIGGIAEASPEGASIQQLDRIINTHSLVEHRNALSIITSKLEAETFEIAVFGRVSCGKSSLLNYLLEGPYLPVDVTPVTTVPTRISHGPHLEIGIEFADKPHRIVQFSELADFATEQGNPGNAKHVTRIHVRLPRQKLDDGITFVDTPGLGSLASDGSSETLTYLPRCDLGIVMLEPSAGVTAEDCLILDALGRAGSTAVMLLTKSDLFDERQREKLIAYVAEEVEKQLGVLVPTFPVSVVGESAILCDRWFTEYLVPKLRIHQQLAAAAIRRKIVILNNAIIASLESRLAWKSESARKPQPHQQMLLEEFREVGMLLESSLRGADEICREIEDQLDRILTETVGEVVTAWMKHADVVPSESLAARICQVLAKPIAGLERGYWQALERATRALAKAEETNPKGLSLDLPAALGMPGLDPTMVCASLNLSKPVLLIALTASMTKQQVYREALGQVGHELQNFLNAYARQLRSWFREAINNLRSAFISAAGIHRTDLEPLDADLLSDRAQIAADLEQLKRTLWNRPNDSTIAQFRAGR